MRKVAAAVLGMTLALGACQEKKPVEHNQRMTPDEAPAKVREAFRRESDTPVATINRHEVNGNVVYQGEATTGGKTYDVEVDSDGRLLRRAQRPARP